jgi:hypothetical protein
LLLLRLVHVYATKDSNTLTGARKAKLGSNALVDVAPRFMRTR